MVDDRTAVAVNDMRTLGGDLDFAVLGRIGMNAEREQADHHKSDEGSKDQFQLDLLLGLSFRLHVTESITITYSAENAKKKPDSQRTEGMAAGVKVTHPHRGLDDSWLRSRYTASNCTRLTKHGLLGWINSI